MTQDQQDLLEKARASLDAARVLFSAGHYDFAAPRAYYSMFYIAEAFLEGEGLAFSKHQAVIAAFGHQFAHTGRVPREFHHYLTGAFELRHDGDYGPPKAITEKKAQEAIAHAQLFLELAERLIGPLPPERRDNA
jgi:uncharacterized protein (UPF0332 family)